MNNINKMIEELTSKAIELSAEFDCFCAEDARDISVFAIDPDDKEVVNDIENYNIMEQVVQLLE